MTIKRILPSLLDFSLSYSLSVPGQKFEPPHYQYLYQTFNYDFLIVGKLLKNTTNILQQTLNSIPVSRFCRIYCALWPFAPRQPLFREKRKYCTCHQPRIRCHLQWGYSLHFKRELADGGEWQRITLSIRRSHKLSSSTSSFCKQFVTTKGMHYRHKMSLSLSMAVSHLLVTSQGSTASLNSVAACSKFRSRVGWGFTPALMHKKYYSEFENSLYEEQSRYCDM